MSPKKGETAVHGCNPILTVSVVLVSRKVSFFFVEYQPCSFTCILDDEPTSLFKVRYFLYFLGEFGDVGTISKVLYCFFIFAMFKLIE